MEVGCKVLNVIFWIHVINKIGRLDGMVKYFFFICNRIKLIKENFILSKQY